MSVQVESLLDREVRYHVVRAAAIDVVVETHSSGKRATLQAELMDMSQGGLRLRSKTPVPAADLLTITVTFKGVAGISNPLTISGQVCWTAPVRKETFYVACSIEPTIPQLLLEDLAANRILERRCDWRQKTSLNLPARWECDPAEMSASILNLSDGGICLLISQMRQVGGRIRPTLFDEDERPEYVFVTVCWQIDTDDGHVVGCRFIDREATLRLRHLVDLQATIDCPM